MDEEDRRSSTKTCKPFHLDSPLRGLQLSKFLRWANNPASFAYDNRGISKKKVSRYRKMMFNLQMILEEAPGNRMLRADTDIGFSKVNAIILERFDSEKIERKFNHYIEHYHLLLDVSLSNFELQIPIIEKFDKVRIDFNQIRSKIMSSQDLKKLFLLKNILEEGSVLSGTSRNVNPKLRSKTSWITKDHSYLLYLDSQVFISLSEDFSLVSIDGIKMIGTRDHYLGLADLYSQRFNLMLSSALAEILNDQTYLYPDELTKIFKWGDEWLERHGNNGFSLISKWEALMTGSILTSEMDPLVDSSQFLTKLIEGLEPDQQLHALESVELAKQLISVNHHKLTQAFGLFRIWGHPTTNSIQGIKKLKKIACQPRKMNANKIKLIHCKFKEYFCLAYYKKHQQYPNLDFSSLRSTSYIRKCLSRNLPLRTSNHTYVLSDWVNVGGLKTFDTPKQYDISELISDKAMSFGANKLHQSLMKDGHIGLAQDRSVLINWMQSELGDPEEFLQSIDKHGFPKDEIYVGVCPKERELKMEARMFALMPLVKRMYVVMTEALIADHILPYFPEITMKDNQLDLMTRHFSNTSSMGTKNSTYKIIINSDFEKWNTNMRREETLECFKFMDQLHGYEAVISRTHDLFSGIIYLADDEADHSFENGLIKLGDYAWTHHLGGLEGMRQKGWTVWTVVILKYCMEKTGTHGTIIGQGDNQVIIVTYHISTPIDIVKQLFARFKNFLIVFLSDLGPPLKADETWESSLFFSYGKFPIFRGVPLSMGQKKIARMLKLSNEGFPTLESSLSSLSASFFDSSSMQDSVIIPFILYSFNTADCIYHYLYMSPLLNRPYMHEAIQKHMFKIPNGRGGQYETTFEINRNFKNDLINFPRKIIPIILIYPRCLGGYPISLIGDVLARGFPDPLTLSLSQLQIIRRTCDAQTSKFIESILCPGFSPFPQYEMLFSDPVSVNLLHPSSPGEQLKRRVLDLIKSPVIQKSNQFSSFLKKTSSDQKELADLLSTMTPVLNPRIAHDLMECTVESRANKITARIEKTKTLVNLMVKNVEGDLNRLISLSEINYLCSVIYGISYKNPSVPYSSCSTTLANFLRSTSWKKNISGVTSASPFEAFVGIRTTDGECSESCIHKDKGYISVRILKDIPTVISELGESRPYLGSTTGEKVMKSFGTKVMSKSSSLVKKSASLLRLINWGTQQDSNLAKLIEKSFKAVTDAPADLMIVRSDQISGSYEHRWKDNLSSHGCYLPVLYSGSSYINISNTTLVAYSKGTKNVNLMFQAPMTITEAICSSVRSKEGSLHLHIGCEDCIVPINEFMLDIESNDFDFSSYPDDHQFFSKSIDLIPEIKTISNFGMLKLLSHDDLDETNKLFYTSASFWIVEKLIEFSGDNKYSAGETSLNSMIPNSWVYKMDVLNLIPKVTSLLHSHLMFLDKNFHDTQLFLNYLSGVPRGFFSIFLPLSLDFNSITSLSQEYSVDLPVGDPPSIEGWMEFFRAVLIKSIDQLIHLPMFAYNTSKGSISFLWTFLLHYYHMEDLDLEELYLLKTLMPWEVVKTSHNRIDILAVLKYTLLSYTSQSLTQIINKLSAIELRFSDTSPDYWAHFLKPNRPHQESGIGEILLPYEFNECNLLKKINNKENENLVEVSGFIPPANPLKTQLDIGTMTRCLSKTGACLYKAVELYSYLIHKKQWRVHHIVSMGDGNGAFSVIGKKLYSDATVIFNTLFHPDKLQNEGVEGYYPAEFYNFPEVAQDLLGLNTVKYGVSDVLDPRWPRQTIYDSVRGKDGLLIISDVELTLESQMKRMLFIQRIGSIIESLKPTYFIAKAYYSNVDEFNCMIYMLASKFKLISVMKLASSNLSSSECYVFCEIQNQLNSNFSYDVESSKFSIVIPQMVIEKLKSPIEHVNSYNKHLKTISEINKILLNDYYEYFGEVYKFPSYFVSKDTGDYPFIKCFNKYTKFLSDNLELSWKEHKFLKLDVKKTINYQNLALSHLLIIGTKLISNQKTFNQFVHLYENGYLYVYYSRYGVWLSVVSDKRYPFLNHIVHSRQFKTLINRPTFKRLLKDIGQCQVFEGLKNLRFSGSFKQTFPLSKYRKDQWYLDSHKTVHGCPSRVLPVDDAFGKSLFQNLYEGNTRKLTFLDDAGEKICFQIPVTGWTRKLTGLLKARNG